MKRANISTTKNNLSKFIDEVRAGQSILIVDRDTPVARLEPVGKCQGSNEPLAELERNGIVNIPQKPFDVTGFLNRPTRVRLSRGESVTDAILEEREAGR